MHVGGDMSYYLIILSLIAAALDWLAVFRKFKTLEYIMKPGFIILLSSWLFSVAGFRGSLIWFGLGLLFSLSGDVFLMLPQEQFIAGLVAFLFAHLSYIAGFNNTPPPINIVSVILALIVSLTTFQFYQKISYSLQHTSKTKLRFPVMIYTIVISLMLVSGLITLVREEWAAFPAILVSVGAFAFYFSDAFLAWDKFVKHVPYGRLLVIVTYQLGQMLIIIGAVLHYRV